MAITELKDAQLVQCPICTAVCEFTCIQTCEYTKVTCTYCNTEMRFNTNDFTLLDLKRIFSLSVPPLGKEYLDHTKN